jgi:acyl-CoA dehydrogenase
MYKAPVAEMSHTLRQVIGIEHDLESGAFGDLNGELLEAVLSEAARFASEEVEPIVVPAEKVGAALKDSVVTMPAGWKELYHAWIDGGWNSVASPVEHGGQGLPLMVSMAALEMWCSCSLAFGLCPTLTMGAVEAIAAHGTEELKAQYLPKMISGEWTGTMNLTEPQAGSDLSAMRSRAERKEDGSYRIFGQKIFITFGEHDITENIIHLVLARLPDAPAGTRGISLFLVPKFLPNADGTSGARNDLFCASIEHKMGIHSSPTCVMIYGDGYAKGAEKGAVGWLIGEENKGLACMFTMMNNARLAVGVQGLAIAEASFQKALAFAHERKQGRAVGSKSEGMSPIIEHPDVKRMLMDMKSLTQAARSICYACAHAIDMSHQGGPDAEEWAARAGLLTPLAKSFATDIGMEVSSLGVQVHGGMGFIEETGAARYMRDARIAPIYEGTNGIQAIDLVMRKLPLGKGQHVFDYLVELGHVAEDLRKSNLPGLDGTAARLEAALGDAVGTTHFLQTMVKDGKTDTALAGATPYQRLFSLAAGGAYLAKGALAGGDAGRIALFRFFADNTLPETAALRDQVENGAPSLLEGADAALAAA